jgi:diaminopimelate epimerase
VLTRSHGLGNDYLVADPAELPFQPSPRRVQLLCDRHFGVGSDGLLLLNGELGLRIINPDGSEAEKSGNGLRIFARWLFDTGRAPARSFVVRLADGSSAAVTVHTDGSVRVDMGTPVFREDLALLEIDGERLDVTALSIGNPHCVLFGLDLNDANLQRFGPRVERHNAFPNRTNVQLARATTEHDVELMIWERGAGETKASGSSACAAVAAAHRRGLVGGEVTAHMPGGDLEVRIDNDGGLHQRGPVEEIARVTLSHDLIRRLRALP